MFSPTSAGAWPGHTITTHTPMTGLSPPPPVPYPGHTIPPHPPPHGWAELPQAPLCQHPAQDTRTLPHGWARRPAPCPGYTQNRSPRSSPHRHRRPRAQPAASPPAAPSSGPGTSAHGCSPGQPHSLPPPALSGLPTRVISAPRQHRDRGSPPVTTDPRIQNGGACC